MGKHTRGVGGVGVAGGGGRSGGGGDSGANKISGKSGRQVEEKP